MAVTIIGAGNMGRGIGHRPVAGGHDVTVVDRDPEEAKETVAQLVRDGGLRAIDAGPLEHARHLEGFMFLHMMVQQQLGTGFGSAVKILA